MNIENSDLSKISEDSHNNLDRENFNFPLICDKNESNKFKKK